MRRNHRSWVWFRRQWAVRIAIQNQGHDSPETRRMSDQARFRGNGESAHSGSARAELAARLKAILQLTDELFGGHSVIRVETDPDDNSQGCLVVRARTSLDARKAMESRLEWHRRVTAVVGGPHNLKLAIDTET